MCYHAQKIILCVCTNLSSSADYRQILCVSQIDRPCRQLLASMQKTLDTISSEFPDDDICGLAGDLTVCIATLGAVCPQDMHTYLKTNKKKVRDEVYGSLGDKDAISEQPKDLTEQATELTSYQTALKQIKDPLIPVRGHALIALTQLVKSRDVETLRNAATLLQVFKECLLHSDSYVYLAAINGLVALALSSSPAISGSILTTSTPSLVADQTPQPGQSMIKSLESYGLVILQ